MRNLLLRDLNRPAKKKFIKPIARSKAWSILVKKSMNSAPYFFKGRLGKRCKKVLLDAGKQQRCFPYKLQTRESGCLTLPQLEVLWRSVRKKSRRFAVNLKRFPMSTFLQLTATRIVTGRKKGGRMGSGKSAISGHQASLKSGKVFFFSSEVRKSEAIGFLAFRGVLKKISLRISVKFTR